MIKETMEMKSGGGTYHGALTCGITTHLIAREPKGAKYEAAKSSKIAIVKIAWLVDSVAAGYCLPESDYLLDFGDKKE
jgi:topoisomerase (DNA) II binding protein 1